MHPANWRRYWRDVRALPPDKERLRRSLAWAVLTVHTQVSISEHDFAVYMETGDVPNHWLRTRRLRALKDVDAYVARLDFARFLRWPLARKLDHVVAAVHGLGYAKTAFALTFCGLADVACLDIWALRLKLGLERRTWKNGRAYLADSRKAFGARAGGQQQWAFYWRLPNSAGRAFRRTSHAIVFHHLGVTVDAQQRLTI